MEKLLHVQMVNSSKTFVKTKDCLSRSPNPNNKPFFFLVDGL